MVVRPTPGAAGSGPVMPDQQKDATVIRVNVRDLQAGKLSLNVALA